MRLGTGESWTEYVRPSNLTPSLEGTNLNPPGWIASFCPGTRGRLARLVDPERVEQEARHLRVSGNRSTPFGVASECPVSVGLAMLDPRLFKLVPFGDD